MVVKEFRIKNMMIPTSINNIIDNGKSKNIEMGVLRNFGGTAPDFGVVYMCVLFGIYSSKGDLPEIPKDEENWCVKNQVKIKESEFREFGVTVKNEMIDNIADPIFLSYIKKHGMIKSTDIKKKKELYRLMENILGNENDYWEMILLPFYLNRVCKKDKIGLSFVSRLAASRSINVENKGTIEQIFDDQSINEKVLKGDKISSIERIASDFIDAQKKFYEEIKIKQLNS